MCENRENLCKSVIGKMKPKSVWDESVYLSDTCKERFLTSSDIPELNQEDIFMAGMTELVDGYHVEREGIAVHSLVITLEGSGILTTADRVVIIEPYTLVVLPAHIPFRFDLFLLRFLTPVRIGPYANKIPFEIHSEKGFQHKYLCVKR